jgi:peptidoglycan hydrolase-like protein with peptidoglycan-binding domain
LVVVVALAGTVFVLDARAHRTAAAPPSARVSTATVVRTDLSNSQTLPGTLGFGAPVPVMGKGTGVITSLPTAGATVARGQSLYRADDRPVVVFYGDTPLFRTLALPTDPPPTTPPPTTPPPKTPELSGRDVTVVAQNLKALGYQIGHQPSSATTSGYVYTAALAAAVKRWQRAVGMAATGTLDVGQVVVFPDAVRVNAIQAQLGDLVAEPLMSVTPTDKVITVPVAATDMNDIVSGAKVTIGLPDDRQIPGTVTSISQAVQSNSGQDPNNPTATPTLNVGVTPLHDADVAQLAAAPVQVTFTTGVRKGVLAVPVTALLALSGGGYALQRSDGTLVGIRTGLFADGLVEVSGTGVTAGLRVQTAS